MRILVTGRRGQVAQTLAERINGRHELIFGHRPDLDLLDPQSIVRTVREVQPDLIFSVAAYTAVDQAEIDRDIAMAINAEAPGVLARAAARAGASILHLSTDYVFDGAAAEAYREDDTTGPINAYGASKLAGEQAVRASGATYAILRTAWVYSAFGRNFVETMLRLADHCRQLDVVEDEFGCPTCALDLVEGMLRVADAWQIDRDHGANAIYNLAGSGETNWADFARAIFALGAGYGGPTAAVRGIPSCTFPRLARRPANSRLDSSRFARIFGFRPPGWQVSLEPIVARLLTKSIRQPLGTAPPSPRQQGDRIRDCCHVRSIPSS